MKDFLSLINVIEEAGEKTREIFGHAVLEKSKENDEINFLRKPRRKMIS
jgi:hypothetical protein